MVLILVFLTFAFTILTQSVIRHLSGKRTVSSAKVPGPNFVYRLKLGY